MDLHLSARTEQIIHSLLQGGRFASPEEVVEEAVRRLEGEASPQAAADASIAADQELQRRLFAAGLITEIRPSVRVDTGTERFIPIKIEGEPLSETIIRERR